ncbi:S9 family peptidase [Gulosibacter macacae]|uniref:S9 family peptidase n=1 Tax=Gulosibacter macacae TaxID=2488791 RepID=A0A3P3VYM7_9MICO|nr:S9 family peptidase [Gulosibacter macacae]RRJ87810.1 S9 family peptidase [Gulosibacter macacae]
MPESLAPQPPIARKVPVERRHHGDLFIDDYEWMREKTSPEVIAHLEAENAYTEAITAEQAPLREAIYAEIKGRTQETDLSVPRRRGEWWYFARTVEGGQHAVHCRVPAANSGDAIADWTPPVPVPGQTLPDEQVVLDSNAEAAEHDFYALGGLDVSHDGRLVAWAIDTAGDERFTLRVRDIESGEVLPDEIVEIGYGMRFLPGDRELVYTVVDESWRPHELRRHTLGTPVSDDEVLLREDDPEAWLSAGLSSDERFIVAELGNSEWSEVLLWPLADDSLLPLDTFTAVVPRSNRLLHEVEPVIVGDVPMLALVHHQDARNGELALVTEAALAAAQSDSARTLASLEPRVVLPATESVRISGVANTGAHLVIESMSDGVPGVSVISLNSVAGVDAAGASELPLLRPALDDPLVAVAHDELEYGSPMLRLMLDTWTRAARSVEVSYDDLARGVAPTLRREAPVLGGYIASDYLAERHWATANDGVRIPITVLRRREVQLDGTAPAIIYGYGSYEISLEPGLALSRISALDRGAVHVIAHVRGGGELGRGWYEDGKKLSKPNSFTDFVAVTCYLADAGLVDGDRIAAYGGSAGGLLMGAVANLAPERYRAIAAIVPFVDPLTSVLDPELPLSALEWEEWGNPITDPESYAAIRAYSPYENVAAIDYPAIAAVTSLNDTRVLYVEPAKWVARLREFGTGTAPILLKTEMAGGHGGASGRYERWRDQAWVQAFLLSAIGATELLPGAGLRGDRDGD